MLPISEVHLAHVLHITALWPLLEYPHLFTRSMLPAHKLACQVWKQAKAVADFTDVIADMPIWSNTGMPEFTFVNFCK